MKTSAWSIAAGLALGVTGVLTLSAPRVALASAPAADEKADLTPRYTKGQTLTFKQHTVRKDSMTLGGMPAPEKPADKPADAGKEAPATKSETPKSDAAKADTPKADATKPEGAKAEQPKDTKPAAGSGMTSVQTTDLTATYELRVIDVDEKGASMELELKNVVATAEVPAGKYTWDSAPTPDDKDANNPILVAFRPVIGAVMKIAIGPDGNITKVEPDSRITAPPGGPLAPMVQQLVGADGVRLRVGPALWIKDGREPAVVGKPWTNSDEMLFRAVGKFTYESTNTLKSVKDNVAQIDIAGLVKLGGADDTHPATGTLKDQSAKGSCTWDTKAGLVKTHVWEQKTVLDLKVGGAIDVVRTSEFTVTTTRE